jgi:hypothetical protein
MAFRPLTAALSSRTIMAAGRSEVERRAGQF